MKKLFVALISFAALMTPTFAQVDPDLATKSGCLACHRQDKGLIGPSYDEVQEKYKDEEGAVEKLIVKVKNGGSGVWGNIPMAPNFHVADEDIETLVKQILHK